MPIKSLGKFGNFGATLERLLVSCGYVAWGEGIFAYQRPGRQIDWLSIDGNSYYYVVNVGVVFPKLSAEMKNLLPSQQGHANAFSDVDASILPFVFSPLSRYVALPSRGKCPTASAVLLEDDAEELADVLCGPLLKALSRFHDLGFAIEEVEETLMDGGAKAFLRIVAYIWAERFPSAVKFSRMIMDSLKSEPMREYYKMFLSKVEKAHGIALI